MIRRSLVPGLLVLAPALFAAAAPAQDADSARSKVDAALQARIDGAIARGVECLLAEQEIDGSWRGHLESYRNGQTALAVYTLLKCDLPGDHPAVRRALEYLRGAPTTRTYSAGVLLMALAELDADAHEDWIEELAEELLSWQRGGWGYPDSHVDLSNTQYAALGLRAATKAGYRVPAKAWERLAEWTLAQQESARDAAGFRYVNGHDATGSMTSAGISVLAICREGLRRTSRDIDDALERGMAWVARNFSVTPNPLTPFDGRDTTATAGGHVYYHVYGMERVGALMQTSTFGQHDWYHAGASWLVDDQKAHGAWGGQADTCFALLFLARATSRVRYTGGAAPRRAADTYGDDDPAADVSLRAAGERPLALWVSSFGERALADFAWEGEAERGLRVARVEYCLEDPEAPDGVRVLARVDGRPAQPSGAERFAARFVPERAGRLRIFARVLVVPRDVPIDAPEDELQPLDSRTLTIDVSRADDPRLDEYARDAGDCVLRDARVRVTASSKRDGQHPPERAVDGLVGTGWFATPDDAAPWIELDLSRAVRAERLRLTQATDAAGGALRPDQPDSDRPPRVRRVRVLLDGDRSGFELELDPDPRVKTELVFPRPVKLRTLRVEVLEVEPGPRADRGVGLAEVELFGPRRRGGR